LHLVVSLVAANGMRRVAMRKFKTLGYPLVATSPNTEAPFHEQPNNHLIIQRR
jgi:hypothetical protein